MVDPCEDNCRMKHKLNKNPAGLDYLPNFLAATQASTNDAADAAMARLTSSASSGDLSSASSAHKASVATSAQGTVTTAESGTVRRADSTNSMNER
jgi:hypothetical protein